MKALPSLRPWKGFELARLEAHIMLSKDSTEGLESHQLDLLPRRPNSQWSVTGTSPPCDSSYNEEPPRSTSVSIVNLQLYNRSSRSLLSFEGHEKLPWPNSCQHQRSGTRWLRVLTPDASTVSRWRLRGIGGGHNSIVLYSYFLLLYLCLCIFKKFYELILFFGILMFLDLS